MTQFYFDPARASDPYALPDAECFYAAEGELFGEDGSELEPGWYWQACFPGCLPDGEPVGPFDSEAEAIADAQEQP